MPRPVRALPVVQNWDCSGCGDCCRTYHVPVSAAEKARIDAQNWDADPELAGVIRVVPDQASGAFRLNHRADEACVFLGPDARCRIHAKFGSAAKPMACRIYPFVLVPAGDHWRAGVRFACPTAVANKGRRLPEHAADVREYAGLLEDAAPPGATVAPPPLQPGQAVDWPDLVRFAAALAGVTAGPGAIERKLRTVIALSSLCRKAKFDAVRGKRLTEFLDLVTAAAADDVPDVEKVPPPGWVGRMVFRQLAAVYARKDVGLNRGAMADRGAGGRILAAWRFARGTGTVPPVHAFIPPGATFAAAEAPSGAMPAESEELLSRYFRVKLESLQFCGPTNHHLGFWDGLDSLVLTFPAIMWLSRVLAAGGKPRTDAVAAALRIVDDNFGFNPLLAGGRQTWAVRTLQSRGELAKLVAWYAR